MKRAYLFALALLGFLAANVLRIEFPVAWAQVCAGPNYIAGVGIQIVSSVIGTKNVPTGVINVKTDEGAKGDSSTDDTLAIQKAITDAIAAGGDATEGYYPFKVYLPGTPGSCYKTTFPLWVTGETTGANPSSFYLDFQGGGKASTSICASALFPALFVAPGNYTSSIDDGAGAGNLWVAPLVGSTGQSMQMNGNNVSWGMDAKTAFTSPTPFSGLSAFTVQFWADVTDLTGDTYGGQWIGGRGSGDGYHTASSVTLYGPLSFGYGVTTGTANIDVVWHLTSGLKYITAPTFTGSAVHFFESSWDGSNIRTFIDGVEVNKTAATGTLIDNGYDPMFIGATAYWPDFAINSSPIGQMFGLRISNIARHTTDTTYTPPTSAMSGDSNTLLLLNGITVNSAKSTASAAGPFVQPEYVNGSANSTIWLAMLQKDQPEYQSVNISNLTVIGGSVGMTTISTIDSRFENLFFSYPKRYGIMMQGVSYNDNLDSVQLDMDPNATVGYDLVWNGITCKNCSTDSGGALYSVVDAGGNHWIDPFFQMNAGSQVCMVINPVRNNNTPLTEIIEGLACDDENGAPGPNLTIQGGMTVTLIGGEMNASTGNTPPIMLPGSSQTGSPPLTVNIEGMQFVGTPAYWIAAQGDSTLGTNQHISFKDNQFNWKDYNRNTIPLVDAAGGIDYTVSDDPTVIVAGTTAGTYSWTLPSYSSRFKRVTVNLAAYENTTGTAQTATLPEGGLTSIGSVVTDSGTCTGVTISTSTITLPSSMGGTQTGICEAVGY